MSAQIKTFIDENGNQLLPQTSASAVYTLEGLTVEEVLNNLPEQIRQIIIENGGGSSSTDIETVLSYIANHISDKTNPHDVTAAQINALPIYGVFKNDNYPEGLDQSNIPVGMYTLSNYDGTAYNLLNAMYGVFIQCSGSYKIQVVYASTSSQPPKFYLRRWLTSSSKWTGWSTFLTNEDTANFLTNEDATNLLTKYVTKTGDTMTGTLNINVNSGSPAQFVARHPDLNTYITLINNTTGQYRGLFEQNEEGTQSYLMCSDSVNKTVRIGMPAVYKKVYLGCLDVFVDKVGAADGTGKNVLQGAAWNDYAEYRESDCQDPGRVICENGDDTLSIATRRMQPGANVVSDTFGFSIGKTDQAKTPIAVSGRVLVYPYEDRNSYAPGDAVCAAPNGTVSKMTREEIREYPECIVGTVSAIPNYETWGEGNIAVNGRIWIKVK